jgi:hypothetical protein
MITIPHVARFNPLVGEESTVFQGKPIRRDRRKSHVREADKMAEAYFEGECGCAFHQYLG